MSVPYLATFNLGFLDKALNKMFVLAIHLPQIFDNTVKKKLFPGNVPPVISSLLHILIELNEMNFVRWNPYQDEGNGLKQPWQKAWSAIGDVQLHVVWNYVDVGEMDIWQAKIKIVRDMLNLLMITIVSLKLLYHHVMDFGKESAFHGVRVNVSWRFTK